MIDVHSLTPDQGVLLYRDTTAAPAIEVREHDGVRWLHFGDRAVQSAMLVQRPAQVLLPYLQCMLTALVFNPKPSRLLNLGMGGGAFNRFFNAFVPELEIDSVEQDPRVVATAEQYFGVDGGSCHVDSAERYLARAVENELMGEGEGERKGNQSYDLVLCDVYSEDALPRVLKMPQTYQQLEQLTSNSAVLAFNLLPDSEQELLTVLQLARTAFPFTALLEVPDYRNIVLLASPQSLAMRQESAALKDWLPDVDTFLATLRRVPDQQ